MWSYVQECKDLLHNKHMAIVYKHFLHLHVIMLQALFDWMQRVSTATNTNPYLVSPKFYLNLPRVKRTGLDCNPWPAKMQTPRKHQRRQSFIKFQNYNCNQIKHTWNSWYIPDLMQSFPLYYYYIDVLGDDFPDMELSMCRKWWIKPGFKAIQTSHLNISRISVHSIASCFCDINR